MLAWLSNASMSRDTLLILDSLETILQWDPKLESFSLRALRLIQELLAMNSNGIKVAASTCDMEMVHALDLGQHFNKVVHVPGVTKEEAGMVLCSRDSGLDPATVWESAMSKQLEMHRGLRQGELPKAVPIVGLLRASTTLTYCPHVIT